MADSKMNIGDKWSVLGFISIKQFGAVGDGVTDDTQAVKDAITYAIANGGLTVWIPAGTYLMTTQVNISGSFSMRGMGYKSVLNFPNVNHWGFIVTSNTGGTLKDFKILSNAGGLTSTSRTTDAMNLGLFSCSRMTVDAVHCEGSYAAGILSSGLTDSRIVNCEVRNTLADGYHFTGASKDVVCANNIAINTGDDAYAVVSYAGAVATTLCERITIVGNLSRDSWARGVCVAGGKDIVVSNNNIRHSNSDGIIVVLDSNYGTHRCYNVLVEGNNINQAGTYSDAPRTMTGNRDGIEIGANASINLIVRGNVITEGAGRGISMANGNENLTVVGNTARLNKGVGFNMGVVGGTKNWNLVFSENISELNSGHGMYFANWTGADISNNISNNNNFVDMTNRSAVFDGTNNWKTNMWIDTCTQLNVSGNSAIEDWTNVTYYFSPFDATLTLPCNLSITINTGATTATLTSAQPLPTTTPFNIKIDNEIITVGAISGNTISSLTRAVSGTTAASHLIGAPVVDVVTQKSRVAGGITIANSGGLKIGYNTIFNQGGVEALETLNTCTNVERHSYWGTGTPTSTVYKTGQRYTKTATNEVFLYNGTAWDIIYPPAGTVTAALSQVSSLTAATSADRGKSVLLLGATAISEVVSLLIGVPGTTSTAGNVTLTLDGVQFIVAVGSGNTDAQVATILRAATYSGWTTGGTSTTVTFTATVAGAKLDPVYKPGATGTTGIFTVSTQGVGGTPDVIYTAVRTGNGTYDWQA